MSRVVEIFLNPCCEARYFHIDLKEVSEEEKVQACRILDTQEIAKGMQYAFTKDRVNFFMTWACIRRTLANLLNVPPRGIRFLRNEFGKPYLFDNILNFNLCVFIAF